MKSMCKGNYYMRVGFFHDGPFLTRDKDGKYYGLTVDNVWFKRYFNLGDELELCMRYRDINISGKTEITVDKIYLTECCDISSIRGIFKRKEARAIICKVLQRCDRIIIRLPSMIGAIAAEECNKCGKTYIVEMVADPWDTYWNHSLKGKIIAPIITLQTKILLKKAPATIYVTNEYLQKRYPTEGVAIGCSDVQLKNLDDKILQKRIDKIREQSEKIIIGTTAAVSVKYKGQQYVIEALGYLKKMGVKNFEYQLVGGGDSSFLKEVAEKCDVVEQVKFLGGMSHEKVFDWLDSIDLYVQPSRQEGLPRALVEAMSRGVPAFGAHTGGIPELIEQEFIFSNTSKNKIEIAEILMKFTKEKMIIQANRNFNKAREYQREMLEEKRYNFCKNFYEKGE